MANCPDALGSSQLKKECIVSDIFDIESLENVAVSETGLRAHEELGGIVPNSWVVELQPTRDGPGQWDERFARFQFWRSFWRGD